jgi:hypothetical protein
MGRVRERLNPMEEKIAEFKSAKDGLEKDIEESRNSLDFCKKEISKIHEDPKFEKYPSVRRINRKKIKEFEREMKHFRKEIAICQKEHGTIDKKFIKQNKKADPLRDKLNELADITNRKGKDTSVDERSPRLKAPSFEMGDTKIHSTGGKNGEGEGDSGAASIGKGGDNPSRPRSPETEKKYPAKDLIDTWNRLHGTHTMINLENHPNFFGQNESAPDFLRHAAIYSERYGDEERFEGMPSMKKAAKKKKGWWKLFFGRRNRGFTQSGFLRALNSKK